MSVPEYHSFALMVWAMIGFSNAISDIAECCPWKIHTLLWKLKNHRLSVIPAFHGDISWEHVSSFVLTASLQQFTGIPKSTCLSLIIPDIKLYT